MGFVAAATAATVPAISGVTDQPATVGTGAAIAASASDTAQIRACCGAGRLSTHTAEAPATAVTEQEPGVTARTPGTAGAAVQARWDSSRCRGVAPGTADATVSTVAIDPSTGAAVAAGTARAAGLTARAVGTGAAQAAVATAAPQPGRTAATAILADPSGPAVAPVADEPAAIAAVFAGPRRPVGAIANQWTPGQRHRGGIDQVEHSLLDRLQR